MKLYELIIQKLFKKLPNYKSLIEDWYLSMENNLAYYDQLTGLHNRLYYDRVIKPKYCTKECYIVFVDIDNLKTTNDTLGHSEGDKLIKSVAEHIKCWDNNSPIETCRIGGDEFIMILPKDYFDVFEEGSDVNLLVLGASVGIYHKGIFEDVSSGVRKADDTMYINKTHKKG